MTNQNEHLHRRAHRRYDVSLFGHLVTTDASVSVKIANLSFGGAMVMLFMPGHSSLGDQVRALNIEKIGEISCRVVLKRDLAYHLQFTGLANSKDSLEAFLDDISS